MPMLLSVLEPLDSFKAISMENAVDHSTLPENREPDLFVSDCFLPTSTPVPSIHTLAIHNSFVLFISTENLFFHKSFPPCVRL